MGEQRYKKAHEVLYATYEEARKVADGIVPETSEKVKVRKRKDGFAVVTYRLLPPQKKVETTVEIHGLHKLP